MMLSAFPLPSNEVFRTSLSKSENSWVIRTNRNRIVSNSSLIWVVSMRGSIFSLVQFSFSKMCFTELNPPYPRKIFFDKCLLKSVYISNQKSTWAKNLEKGFDNFDPRTSSWGIHFLLFQNVIQGRNTETFVGRQQTNTKVCR